MSELQADYDVVIVGAGPAGLSAALVLGRCCRRVLLCDAGRPRNAASGAVHGFVTRDGIEPSELRSIGRSQLARYQNVIVRDVEVLDAVREAGGFEVALADGSRVATRKLLLAAGLVDVLPPIAGLRELWGRSVHPCPYCDGWEFRGQRLAAYGRGDEVLALCRALTSWSRDIYLFSDGPCELSQADRRLLADRAIILREERVVALERRQQRLWRVMLEGAEPVERDALFVKTPQQQQTLLAEKLGCPLPGGRVETGDCATTPVPGLYVAGDAARDVQLAIVAAAEGARAAFDINRTLVHEAFAI
jgi:thioredoxin reductase